MKRLLGFTGLSSLVVLTACFYLDIWVSYIISAVGLILFVLSLVIPKIPKTSEYPAFFMIMFIISAVFISFTHMSVIPVQTKYDNKEVHIVSTQSEDEYYAYGFYNYELKVKTIDGEKVNSGVILRSPQALYSKVGDEISLNCTLSSEVNDSELSRGYYLESYVFNEEQISITSPEKKSLKFHLLQLRQSLEKNLFFEMDYDTASFSNAVLLGDKYFLENDVRELLRVCGLSHISVVSGLHLSLIISITRKLFRRITLNRYISGTLNIGVILLFSMLTGFGKPVIRAAVMLIIFTVGTMIDRLSDSLNSIGAAAIVLIIINPYCVGDIGMLLSFSSVIGIVLWSGKITEFIMSKLTKLSPFGKKYVKRILNFLVDVMSMSLCATLWTLPITILKFGGFSLISVLANILVVPFMSIVLVSIGFCAITHYIVFLPFIADIFGLVVTFFYKYLIKVCTLLSSIPYSYIQTKDSYFIFWLCTTLFLIGLSLFIGTKKGYITVAILSILILLTGATTNNIISENSVTLYMPDTKYGLCLVAESSDGYAVVSMEGTKTRYYKLENVVNSILSKDNNLLIADYKDISINYGTKLVNEFDYKAVLRYDNGSEESYTALADNEVIFSKDMSVSLWNKGQVELFPSDEGLFTFMTFGDTTILSIPEGSDCSKLDNRYRTPDIIITSGMSENIGLLRCQTLIVPGDSYEASVTAERLAPITEKIVTGTDLEYTFRLN